MFGTAILTETEFTTAMKLAQCRINQRPLVAMSDDPTDNNLLTITPHHLKLGRAAITLPSSLDELENLDNIRLSVQDRWNKRKILQEKFFVKWKDEYLSSLSKNKRIAESATDIKPGSIVLLINERKNRHHWPLARIERVFTSKDGIVRSVELRLPMSAKEVKTKGKKLANKKTGSNNKELCLSEPRLTTRGVENIALLEEALVNQTNSGRLDTTPNTLHHDQEKNDIQMERDSNVDNDADCLASINGNNIDLH